jgi:DNA polymerase-3 subunit beta
MMKISAVSTMGSTYDEVDIAHEGEDLLIAFNNRFLIESLRACDAEKIQISLTSALTSINIEPKNDDENAQELFMLLPVRMRE